MPVLNAPSESFFEDLYRAINYRQNNKLKVQELRSYTF